jgi:hypothetical protein
MAQARGTGGFNEFGSTALEASCQCFAVSIPSLTYDSERFVSVHVRGVEHSWISAGNILLVVFFYRVLDRLIRNQRISRSVA